MLQTFSLSEVQVQEPYMLNALNKEIDYLKAYDSNRLLAYFRTTRGLEAKGENYPGWEDTEIRGHILGHYLSAMAQAYETTYDSDILKRLTYIIDELAECQFKNGYLGAFPEEFFDRVETGQPVWVPWYTMHKIIAGLNKVCEVTSSPQAIKIVKKLGLWVYNRTKSWTPEIQNKVLDVEYGGMNECMYDLYILTGIDEYAIAGHAFDEIDLFTQIRQGNDILNNRHANTTIPKFLGALKRYVALGESEVFYLEAVESFWSMVTSHHSYVMGGNSEWEHFGQPDILDAERTEANCETCNIHNLLKMTKTLFRLTKNHKYAEFYERAFINGILSSQNPETGMTTYFQPMATGYFKVYSQPFEHFWCCTGTGMENFTKLGESIYFKEEETCYVNLYLESLVEWKDKKMSIHQKGGLENPEKALFLIECANEEEACLAFRVPTWAGDLSVQMNRNIVEVHKEKGYIYIQRRWKDGDTLEIDFKPSVQLATLPDNDQVVAFTYGPFVLSAGLGEEAMEKSTTGVMVTIPTRRIKIKDYIVVQANNLEQWKERIRQNLIPVEGESLTFSLVGTDEDEKLYFSPHYKRYKERYGIYWYLVSKGSKELEAYIHKNEEEALEKAAEVDSVPIGNEQYEMVHELVGSHVEAGDRDGYRLRHAKQGGWFSYRMKIDATKTNYLALTYMFGDCRHAFSIFVDDEELAQEIRRGQEWRTPIEKIYEIPKEIAEGKESIIVRFQAEPGQMTANLIDRLRTTTRC